MRVKVSSLLICLLILVSTALQTTLLHYFSIGGVKPDLILMLVVSLALLRGPVRGTIWGFGSGLIEDLLFSGLLGANAFLKTIIGFSLGSLERRIYKENIYTLALLIFAITLVNDLALFLLFYLFQPERLTSLMPFSLIIPRAFYNSLLMPFLFWGIKAVLS